MCFMRRCCIRISPCLRYIEKLVYNTCVSPTRVSCCRRVVEVHVFAVVAPVVAALWVAAVWRRRCRACAGSSSSAGGRQWMPGNRFQPTCAAAATNNRWLDIVRSLPVATWAAISRAPRRSEHAASTKWTLRVASVLRQPRMRGHGRRGNTMVEGLRIAASAHNRLLVLGDAHWLLDASSRRWLFTLAHLLQRLSDTRNDTRTAAEARARPTYWALDTCR